MPMRLHAHSDSYKTKCVLIVAKYAGLDVETFGSGGATTGKIPVLETDQGCIFTSSAIARYVSRINRVSALYGDTLLEGGMVDSWVEFCTHELEVPLQTWVLPVMGVFEEVPEATALAREDVKRALTVLNNHLLHNTYMVGHRFSLADIWVCSALVDGLRLVLDAGFRAPFGNLMRWFNLCMSQPEFSTTFGVVTLCGGAAKGAKGGSPKVTKEAAPKKETAPKKDAAPKKEAAPPKEVAPKKEASPQAAPSALSAEQEAGIKAVGDEIRVLKERLKGEGVSGKKINDNEEVKALVAKLQHLKEGGAAPSPAAAKASPKKEAAPKAAASPRKDASPKATSKKKGGKAEADAPLSAEELAAERKVKLKKTIKEGGKRGVEIEGAADMGGLQFFCTSVAEPDGDVELLLEGVKAMNAKSDPTEEERKGGSGHVGKMVFSAGTEQLAVVAYVPEEKQKECSCEEWLNTVLKEQGGKILSKSKDLCTGTVKANADKGIFPLKIREPMILAANNFLRRKGLFPEDNDDSDEMVFGDDDFPS